MHEKCKWKAAILILTAIGLLKEFRPSGPFLVDYAVDHANFTTEQMTHEILPTTSGSYIVSLLLIMSVTDVLCYKPIIVQGLITNICMWVVTIWFFHGVTWARIRQMFYGFSVIATEVAYFTYMYANIEKKDYKKVTSYSHSAVHFGQFVSGLVGQVLISTGLLDFQELNYLSLAGGVGALIFAIFLPRVLRDPDGGEETAENQPMHKPKEEKVVEKDVEKQGDPGADASPNPSPAPPPPAGLDYTRNLGKARPGLVQRWREAPIHAWNNLRYAYSNPGVIKWSIWWACAYGLYIQVDLYVESLWKEIEHHSHQSVWNGAVHASHSIISVVLGLIIGRTKLCWVTYGCGVFGVGTVLQAVALFMMSQTHDLYVAYGAFILFQTVFQILVIVAKALVAESIRERSEAFIFGTNTFAACVIHLILTFVVTSRHGFKLPIQEQYVVYGVYALVLGVLFFIAGLPRKWERVRNWTEERRNKAKVADKNGDKEQEAEGGKEMSNLAPNSMPYSIPREH